MTTTQCTSLVFQNDPRLKLFKLYLWNKCKYMCNCLLMWQPRFIALSPPSNIYLTKSHVLNTTVVQCQRPNSLHSAMQELWFINPQVKVINCETVPNKEFGNFVSIACFENRYVIKSYVLIIRELINPFHSNHTSPTIEITSLAKIRLLMLRNHCKIILKMLQQVKGPEIEPRRWLWSGT